ncbi:MAG: BamA/TamA family outer membrane protein [Owenweeksia sp.]
MILGLGSCNYTKHVPEGSYILWDNTIYENNNGKAPSEAATILKQRPTGHLLGINMDLAIYNWGNGTDSSFWSRVGEAPVIFDSSKARASARQLQAYYFNKGYFNATSEFKIDTNDHGRRWAYVDYFVYTGQQFYVNKLITQFPNDEMKELAEFFKKDTYLTEGMPYDDDLLNKERERLAQIFRNHGYYKFSRNFISFTADTFQAGDSVKVNLLVSKRPVEQGDSIVYEDYEKYHIKDIFIRPDYSYTKKTKPSDTVEFRTYDITYDTLRYKPRYLTDAVHFKKGRLYEQYKVKESYSHFVSYQGFEVTEINFEEAGRDTSGPVLNAEVNLAPKEKRTFTLETEGTTTSGNLGANVALGWVDRNFFKAGEELQIRINTGIDYQASLNSSGRSRTFEIGGEIGVKFPRFVLPFNTVGLLPKRMRPTSRMSLYANRVRRIEFDRETFGFKLNYNWKETELKTHQVDLLDLSYSQISISSDFQSRLNEIQQIAFNSALISATRYTFTYNQQLDPDKVNYSFFRTSIENSGFTLSALERNLPFGESGEYGVRTIGGVPYYQYVRLDADYRFFWNFKPKYTLANRVYAATIRAYANSIENRPNGSEVRNPPFSRYLYIGGSNDLRAWPAYRLGAGTQPNTVYLPVIRNANGDITEPVDYDSDAVHDTSFALGTIKFLFSSEFRFPMFSFVKGAVFVDAGNIWLNGGLEDEETDFKFEDFLNQMAIGAGFGLRLDFNFFLLRFDVASKVRDPGLIGRGSPWVIDDQPLLNLTYNIALGYPF